VRALPQFIAGLLLGGIVTGFMASVVGGLFTVVGHRASMVLVFVSALLFAAVDFGWVRVRLPQNARQVPQAVMYRGPYVGALQFGFELGTGVRTYMTAAAPITLVTGAALLGDVGQAILAGATFGAGRALMTMARYASRSRDAWDRQLTSSVQTITALCSATVSGCIIRLALAAN
jgi:hypothetical protein